METDPTKRECPGAWNTEALGPDCDILTHQFTTPTREREMTEDGQRFIRLTREHGLLTSEPGRSAMLPCLDDWVRCNQTLMWLVGLTLCVIVWYLLIYSAIAGSVS